MADGVCNSERRWQRWQMLPVIPSKSEIVELSRMSELWTEQREKEKLFITLRIRGLRIRGCKS